MTKEYYYDVEIFPNFFGVTFIPKNINKDLYDFYIKLDKYQLYRKHLKADDDEILDIINDKRNILDKIGVKTFVVWFDPNVKGEYINDTHLIKDFFSSHKTITGYNSYNYDDTMMDIFLYNSRFLDYKGWHKKDNKHICTIMFNKSIDCIEFGKGYHKVLEFKRYYKRPFKGYDIRKILYLDKTYTALKQVAICLKWHRIQDLPYPYTKPIERWQITHVNDYNVNDVLVTKELCENQKAELDLREDISEHFGIDVRNMSRSSIGKAIGVNYYSQFSGISRKEIENGRTMRYRIKCSSLISPLIKFKTKTLQDLLVRIYNKTLVVGSDKEEDKFKMVFNFGGTIYTMAKGGLHSQDAAGIFDILGNCVGYILRDADVDSYYPNGMLKFRVCPAHLLETPFRITVGYTKDTRVDAKHKAKDGFKAAKIARSKGLLVEAAQLEANAKQQQTLADGLKIAINRMYGALNDKNDPFYDPKCTYQTTINLQLALLMLIEELVMADIQVISANTDGIVCKFKPEQEEIYKACCAKWMEYTTFNLEFTDYERYIRNDVNNYIAIKKGFNDEINSLEDKTNIKEITRIENDYIKRKGLFITEVAFNKGYSHPVVAQALNEYFIYGRSYIDYIKNHIHSSKDAIYDYCFSQKSDSKFITYIDQVIDGKIVTTPLQKSNRFYISNELSGGNVYKKSKEPRYYKATKTKPERSAHSITRLITGYNLTVFNDYIELDNYNINFMYYNHECRKIIDGKNKKTDGIDSANYEYSFMNALNVETKKEELSQTSLNFDYNDIDETPQSVNYDFVPNNTIWGVMGYESREDYEAAEAKSIEQLVDNYDSSDDRTAIPANFDPGDWDDSGDLPF